MTKDIPSYISGPAGSSPTSTDVPSARLYTWKILSSFVLDFKDSSSGCPTAFP